MKVRPANLDWRQTHHLLADAIWPRPIVLISTVGEDGVFNVAPFSFVSVPSVKPPLVCIEIATRRDGTRKDTIRNIEFSKEFVINTVDESLAEAMNQASADYPSDVDEFRETGLTPMKADIVKAPMVGESPISFECRVAQVLQFGEAPRFSNFIIGEVVLAHIKDELYVDGAIQTTKLKLIGRLGAELYCRTTDRFEMSRLF